MKKKKNEQPTMNYLNFHMEISVPLLFSKGNARLLKKLKKLFQDIHGFEI
jgi:hypothetical protein